LIVLISLITMIIGSSEKSDESENPARQCDVSSETTDDTDAHRFFLCHTEIKETTEIIFLRTFQLVVANVSDFCEKKNIDFVLIGLISLITMIIGSSEKSNNPARQCDVFYLGSNLCVHILDDKSSSFLTTLLYHFQ